MLACALWTWLVCCCCCKRTVANNNNWLVCRCRVLLQNGVCALEFAGWGAIGVLACALWSWPAGAAAGRRRGAPGCCFRVLLLKWCVCWSWRAGAAAEWCVQCVVARRRCRVSLLGAVAKCLFRVTLSECCVSFGVGLLVPLQGAGAGYYCQKGCLHLRNLGAATRCALWELVCCCRCRGRLWDAYGSVGVGPCWRSRLCRSTKGECLVATQKIFCCLGSMPA